MSKPLRDRLFVSMLRTKRDGDQPWIDEGWTIFDKEDCNGLRSTFQPTTKEAAEAEMARRIAEEEEQPAAKAHRLSLGKALQVADPILDREGFEKVYWGAMRSYGWKKHSTDYKGEPR